MICQWGEAGGRLVGGRLVGGPLIGGPLARGQIIRGSPGLQVALVSHIFMARVCGFT
jgi:hypothetical protein